MIWTCGGRCCGCERAYRPTCPAGPDVRFRGQSGHGCRVAKCPLL